MKIALINENSQCGKNELIYNTLKSVVEPLGHTVQNYGRFSPEDGTERTYVQVGLVGAVLLNSKAADFVVTGCGTGMGAMLALNSFAGVFCGFAEQPLDGYLFSQVNAGNALSLPFAKGFGWGAEVQLKYIFERAFSEKAGQGYPKEWAEAEFRNRNILTDVKKCSCKDMVSTIQGMDTKFLKDTFSDKRFMELFLANSQDKELSDLVEQCAQ